MTDFLRNESGAVTVDWVVMTAAVVGLCIAVLTSIASGSQTRSCSVAKAMVDNPVALTVDGPAEAPC